jgi:hypothetical protein
LCWFATGDAARRIETLSEDGQCRVIDEVAEQSGLLTWDAPPAE